MNYWTKRLKKQNKYQTYNMKNNKYYNKNKNMFYLNKPILQSNKIYKNKYSHNKKYNNNAFKPFIKYYYQSKYYYYNPNPQYKNNYNYFTKPDPNFPNPVDTSNEDCVKYQLCKDCAI